MQNKKNDKIATLPDIIKQLRAEGYTINNGFRKKVMRMCKSNDLTTYNTRDLLVAHNKNTGGETDIFTYDDGHNWLNAPLFKMSDLRAILDKKA